VGIPHSGDFQLEKLAVFHSPTEKILSSFKRLDKNPIN